MVEDEDAAGAGQLGDKALGLGVIDPAHLVVVPEVADRGALIDERKALPVEVDFRPDRPHVADVDLVRVGRHVRAEFAGLGLIGVIARPLGHRLQIIQLGLDIRQIGNAHGLVLLGAFR